ncbi:hypothetical protein G7B40_032050 [Aetokthonos hydrillicola Thurmond2011]|jgi:hypothetical protein|uniref:Uncharacterized protein n=1 Tax=Aetokthonos hydrillicola Thurmond2011 TaxID=2712845 RepID=A0AAP5IGX5_9CYAN|nr:hypothetical protein [Aetokthonos hydrillicola]MBO3463143.1 hypothetical protein [Aetokthonos hydrillicola CCALA 1050]MBW4589663.1 hypothetical protein [Aetokthonos hydrillicola CCALA 1050]MDR9899160.1 hypothetical protein [Aetokthonos hydrillicola Thurmond2011]
MAQIDDIQNTVNDILSGHIKPEQSHAQRSQRHFSAYINEDVERATDIASRMMQIAEAKGGEAGLADAVEECKKIIGSEIPGLVQYILSIDGSLRGSPLQSPSAIIWLQERSESAVKIFSSYTHHGHKLRF